MEFEAYLDDEVSYYNQKAKLYDINSVRSIFALRKGITPSSVEKCRALLVTSNSGFAQAAWKYGQQYEASREVSTVIADFSLANMAWLKAPMGAPSLPTTEVLAFSYAALQPSKGLLNRYLAEIDKLESQGKITERDHQLLRSSVQAQDELMSLTLGEEKALTEGIVSETLRRVSNEIKKEESEKLAAEQEAHRKTKEKLDAQRAERNGILKALYWRCHQKSKICAWFFSSLVELLLLAGLVAGLGLSFRCPIFRWVLIIGVGALLLLTFMNLCFGTTVKRLHQRIQDRCATWFITRDAKAIGLSLGDFQWLSQSLKKSNSEK
jgi:hypothetical protein